MNWQTVYDLARALGVTYRFMPNDGGGRVTLEHDRGSWAGNYSWGDERALIDSALRWLNRLPWPSEDDPRTSPEGTYL